MSDLDFEEEERIPFDSEPIDRKRNSEYNKYLKQQKKESAPTKDGKTNFLWIVGAFICLFAFVVYGYISINNKVKQLTASQNDYIMNISSEAGSVSHAIAKGMLSTVCVSASSTNNGGDVDTFFSGAMASRGSGVILEVNKNAGDAYIITNYHVVCNTTTFKAYSHVWILLWDSVTPIRAVYVGGSSSYDIAVLKVEDSEELKNSSCAAVTLGSSLELCIGEAVVAIGNSMSRNLRVTTGAVSVEEDLMGSTSHNMYISHSADVNSGNSGGGLYDYRGQLVGIVNAKFRDVNEVTGELKYQEVVHGMNYAIPIDMASSIARNIIRNSGVLQRPTLGLTFGTTYEYVDKGYTVNEDGMGYTTYELTISSLSGQFWANDRLISMTYEYAGETIEARLDRLFSIESHIFNLSKGDKVTFVVERGGVVVEIELTVGSLSSVS